MYREIIHAQLGYHCAAVQSLSHAARLVAELDPDAEATVRGVDVVGIIPQSKSMPCRVFSLFFPPHDGACYQKLDNLLAELD